MYAVASRRAIKMEDAVLGIVGVGNVGRKVEHMARTLGLKVLLNDPPRAAREGSEGFVTLDELLEKATIISLHTPLDATTHAMCNDSFFEKIRPGSIFINASRGEVVDEAALLRARPKLSALVLDTWCNEPNVNRVLIDACDIATPHIAGYSYQGKQNGTAAAVRAVAHYFGIQPLFEFFPKTELPENEAVKLDLRGKTQGEIAAIFQYNYPIFTDDFLFRLDPSRFEELRSNYNYRREFFIA
jgi:erythronate-4-phosphate dehydrogenase